MFFTTRLFTKFNLKPTQEILYGYQPILSALKHRKINKVLLLQNKETTKRKKKEVVEGEQKRNEIQKLAEDKRINVENCNRGDIVNLVGQVPTQGIIAIVDKLELKSINGLSKVDSIDRKYKIELKNTKEIEKKVKNKQPIWLLLDRIVDPHNLGAVIRTSLYFNIEGIIISEEDSCKPNATVHKTSSGSLDLMVPYQVKNISTFIKNCKSNGWYILGTAINDIAINLNQFKNEGKPTLLILGSEGKGLKESTLKLCDAICYIPKLDNNELDSLNVSVANGIMLHHLINTNN